MKTIRVVAAVIKAVNKEGSPIIFATQRGNSGAGIKAGNHGRTGYGNSCGRFHRNGRIRLPCVSSFHGLLLVHHREGGPCSEGA